MLPSETNRTVRGGTWGNAWDCTRTEHSDSLQTSWYSLSTLFRPCLNPQEREGECIFQELLMVFVSSHIKKQNPSKITTTPSIYESYLLIRWCIHSEKNTDQVAQNMSKIHFMQACTLIPEQTKSQLRSLQSVSSRASGGKEYWAEGLRVLGIVEERGMLRFASNSTINEDDDR